MAKARRVAEVQGQRSVATIIDETAAEQAHLDRAYARLDVARRMAADLADRLSPAERGGTHQERLVRTAAIEFGSRRLEGLLTGGSPLCFGRIDTIGNEAFHIGRVGVADDDGEQLIVDWRAPVAEPFYRATGPAPMGVRRRRHIRTRDGHVVALDDEWLDASSQPTAAGFTLVGEAALMAAVTGARTGRMGDIVATIQAEQDAAIRAPIAGVLVVAGGPGTGKTAVALHRAAYLLYTHRTRLERIGVLVIGPNPVFLNYIEHVLPSLDERAVVLSTPEQLYNRAEVATTDIPSVRRLKGDARMTHVMAAAVRGRQRPLAKPAMVPFGAYQLLITRRASAAIVERARDAGGLHNEGHVRVRRLLLSHLYRLYRTKLESAAIDGQPTRPPVETTKFRDAIVAERAFRVAVQRIWPALTAETLLSDLLAHPALLRHAGDAILSGAEQSSMVRDKSDPARWSVEDLPLLDELASLLGPIAPRRRESRAEPVEDAEWMADRVEADLRDIGVGVDPTMVARVRKMVVANVHGVQKRPADAWPREFAHCVVDEAQELSPMQWRMLGRRCPTGSFTVAGDLSQASGPWVAASWPEALRELPTGPDAVVAELTVNYRTPQEVMVLAAAVLAEARPDAVIPTPLRAAGVSPVVERVAAGRLVGRAIAAAAAERGAVAPGTVAVIAPALATDELRVEADRHADTARGDSLVLDSPVAILELPLAKGLEFDAVVLVEPAALVAEAEDGLAALYVALTRTTTRLVIIHSQPLPGPLAQSLVS